MKGYGQGWRAGFRQSKALTERQTRERSTNFTSPNMSCEVTASLGYLPFAPRRARRLDWDPAVPSRRDLRGLRPHRARHWTVDAVSSNGGLLAPKSCHLRGRATAKTAHKPSLFPRRASDVQGVTDFLPCRWNPLQCWVLGVQGASAGTDVFLLAEHASETSPKTITFLLKPAPLLGSSVQQA